MRVMKPVIRRAVVNDLPKMYAISRKAHQLSYAELIPSTGRNDFNAHYVLSRQSEEKYVLTMKEKLSDPVWHMWVAEWQGKVVGFTLGQREAEHLVVIKGLFVDPSYYSRGVGRALFKALLEIAKRGDTIRLSVIENNYRAKRLYASCGLIFSGHDTKTFFGARLEVMEVHIH
jgi:ribosomal protein S18 acetylase RimI-like enzyme